MSDNRPVLDQKAIETIKSSANPRMEYMLQSFTAQIIANIKANHALQKNNTDPNPVPVNNTVVNVSVDDSLAIVEVDDDDDCMVSLFD